MLDRLRLPRIERKPKKVEIAGTHGLQRSVIVTDAMQDILDEIITNIEAGKGLEERFYRASDGDDELLQNTGIMHIHLGDPHTAECLYLIQYDDVVLLLKLSMHIELRDKPRGSVMMGQFGRRIDDFENAEKAKRVAAAQEKAAEMQRRLAISRKGLLPRRNRSVPPPTDDNK